MKITALTIDGFGVWSGLKLEELDEGLTVIYGPNEAGKTTLMQFMRAMLYGFSPERRRYLPPVYGGQPGGSLQIAGSGGNFQLTRHLADDSMAEEAVLWAADGTRNGEHVLRSLLSNLDEVIFQNVFAVGLREVQELATLSDTDAASLLYNISAGLDRVALIDVMRELQQSRNRLLDASGANCQIAQLLAEREKLRSDQEHSQTAIRRYERLAAERDQLDREATRLDDEAGRLQHELRVVEIALSVREAWHQRAAIDEQLGGAAPDTMPEDAIERLETINGRIDRRLKRVAHLKQQYGELRREGSALAINEALVRLAPRIEALQDQGEWFGSLENRLLELEVETSELEDQLKAQWQKFGFDKSSSPNALPAIPPRSLKLLRQPAAAVARSHRRLKEARQEIQQGQEAQQSLRGQIESALAQRGQSNLAEAMERTSALVGLLRRRVQLDQRLEQSELYRAELEEQSRGLVERQLLPGWILAILGCLFITGPILLVLKTLGLMVSNFLTDPLQWWHVLVGLAATAGSVVAKAALERMSAKRLDTCHRQIDMLQSQIKQIKEERDTLDRQLPRGGGSILVRLQTAESELAALEEIVPFDSRRQAAAQETQAASDRARQLKDELATARRRWNEAITMLGLPKGLSPKQVRQFAAGADKVVEIQQRLDRLREESQQRQRELDGLTSRIRQLASDAGLPSEGMSSQQQIKTLGEQLRQHESARQRRDAIRARLKQLRRKRARHDDTLQKLKSQRRRLLREIGAEDETEFRRRAAQLRQVADLRRDRAALARQIVSAVGSHCTEDDIAHILQHNPPDQLTSQCQQLRDRLNSSQAEVRARFERRGQVAEQLRLMAEDRQPAARRLRQAIVESRLEEAVQRWRSLAVTCRILQTVRTFYERDRQPETLQEASRYLQRMTEGRYVRVWTPLGEQVLRVDDQQGQSLAVEVLSQGAREQLFLCLRLALANSYNRRGVEMPLILDDVLVNFDTRRARATAEVLRDFAETGHQLIVFTCHEHLMRMFQALKVPVTTLPDREAPRAAPPRKRPPKRAPAPEPPPVEPEEPAEEPEEPSLETLAPWEPSDDDLDEAQEIFSDEGDEDPDDLFDEDDLDDADDVYDEESSPFGDEPDDEEDSDESDELDDGMFFDGQGDLTDEDDPDDAEAA